jgi:hypothetical protein
VPLDDRASKLASFVIADRFNEDTQRGERTAIGTAFYVYVPTEADSQRGWIYAVTAAHVVESPNPTWLRVRWDDGRLDEIAVPQWTIHPTEDVAVAPFFYQGLQISWWQTNEFLDVWDRRPTLGDRAYFVGLLAVAQAMVAENIPLVRSGTVGRLYQADMPLKHPDGRITRHEMHLIDSRSYGGFSGAPCLVQFESIRRVDTPSIPGGAIGDLSFTETVLLGLVSGHFDDMRPVEASAEAANDQLIRSIRFPLNTGVALITPVERIRECLMDDELVQDRRRREAGQAVP